MMEVDMQSPPQTFRSVPFTVKRPRSPGSPSQERQTKRLSLAPIGLEGQCTRRTSTATDGVLEGRQDDWVRQARELSIASPLSVSGGIPLSALDAGPSRVDEHMAVDEEESEVLRTHVPGGSRPWTTRSHLPTIHITTTSLPTPGGTTGGVHAQSPAPYSVLTEPPSSSTESTSSTSSVSTQTGATRPPDIFLFPATPSDTPSHQQRFAAQHAGESQTEQQGRMRVLRDRTEGSPRPSRVPEIPAASRRHRVTMGPRADCTKCRIGVKGHWMHFD